MDKNTLYKSPAAQREMMEIYESVLAEWPTPFETMTIPTNYGETFVIAGGEGLSFFLRVVPLSLLGRWGVARLQRIVLGDVELTAAAERFSALSMTYFKPSYGKLPILSDELLRRLTMPVLLLGGGQDSLRNVGKIADRMQNLLPDLSTHIIPDAGHALIDTANWVNPFLKGTIKTHTRSFL